MLEALGFATSNAGLQYLRRRLLATYAQHPLIPERSYVPRGTGMWHPTSFDFDPQAAMAHYDATHPPPPTPLALMVLRTLEVLSAMG